jgi:hypothetical protein
MTELTITVITADEGQKLLFGENGDILYSNIKSYCDKKSLTHLKKQLYIESRRKIKYVITHTKNHPDFKCKQNKNIRYEYRIFVEGGWENAVPYDNDLWVSQYPYGDIFIALENDPEIKKKEKELQKLRKEKIEMINKMTVEQLMELEFAKK